MAFNFDDASSQYIYSESAPIGAIPLTFAAWVVCNASVRQFFYIGDLSGTHRVQGQGVMNISPYSQIVHIATGGTATSSNSIIGLNYGTWCNVGGIAYTSSSRSSIASGSIVGNETSNIGASNAFNLIGIGARYAGGWGATWRGKIGEVALWNITLNADEVASLAKGFKPTRIRPQNLVFYAPLLRNLQDLRGGLALTNNNGATVANHPRVY